MAFIQEVVIEIPKGSNVKYEIEDNILKVDRILYGDFKYPANYGFIENTLDWDGDPLDVLIVGNFKLLPQIKVDVKIIGAMKMIDDGETDTKLIGVLNDDPNLTNINDINDLRKEVLKEFEDFFLHYKDYKNAKVIIPGFENVDYALAELDETKNLFSKYSNMDKKEFISKMKEKFPNKYI